MFQVDWSTAGIILTVVSASATLTWWLSGQFSSIRSLVFERLNLVERILVDKLEYHERHDDTRFGQIREDLAEIRIRNAAKDTMMQTILEKLETGGKRISGEKK